MIEEKFKKGDYIISHHCGDMAVYDKIDKKGYMHFKHYYNAMFHSFNNVKEYTMHINYQKYYDLCSEAEKEALDKLIKDYKSNNENK